MHPQTEGSDHKGGIEGFDAAKSGISSKKTGSREMGGSGEDGAGGADGGKGGVEKRRPKYVTPSEVRGVGVIAVAIAVKVPIHFSNT